MKEIICNIALSIIIIPGIIFTLKIICTDKKEREFKKNMKKHWNKKTVSNKITDDF